MRKTGSILLRAAMLLSLFTAANAQEFVFTSNRLAAETRAADGSRLPQNELFLYRDGSELRLTVTPDEEEWDPAVSPSGRYLAYVVSHGVPDWTMDAPVPELSWSLRIMDLEDGFILEEWPLPDANGHTRPAGGFSIAWYPAEDALLLQHPGPGADNATITRFAVGNEKPEVLTRGRGAWLDLARGWILTTIDSYATAYDPLSGANHTLLQGEALGWHWSGAVVATPGRLLLIDPVTAARTILSALPGDYQLFQQSPDGDRAAWVRNNFSIPAVFVGIAETDDWTISEYLLDDYVESIAWLDSETLVISHIDGEYFTISSLNLSEGDLLPLVATFSDSMGPARLLR